MPKYNIPDECAESDKFQLTHRIDIRNKNNKKNNNNKTTTTTTSKTTTKITLTTLPAKMKYKPIKNIMFIGSKAHLRTKSVLTIVYEN